MKKIIVFFMTLALIFTLGACSGKKPTAQVENEIVKRSSYSFDLKVDDKDIVTKGSVLVNFYKITKKDDSLVSTKTLSTFSENVSVTGLDSNSDYRADVVCTYNKKSHIIYSWTFKTNEKGTEFDPIVITTFKELVDSIANDYSTDAYYELANDIDFNDYKDEEGKAIEFSGMSNTSSVSFQGHLDGKGYSIKNVTVTSSQTYNGIFGYLKGTIENLKIENANVNVTRDSSTTTYSGILCGYGYQAKLIDVDIIDSKLTVSAKTQYTGGIAGYGFATNFNYCDTKNVDITSTGATSTAYVGGIASYLCQNSSSKYGKIYSTTANGKVSVSGCQTLYYGGLVGLLKAGASIDRGLADINATINGYGATKAGGIIGQANLNSADSSKAVNNVVAKGNITFKSIKETEVIECNDDIVIGGLIGSATAVYVDSAYIEMDIDIEAKAKENKKIYSGLAFGNGFEAHTELHNSIINGSIKAVTTGSNDAAEISIHGYDGATYIVSGDEKPLSTIDKETVKHVKIELDVDGATQTYAEAIAISDAKTASNWDLNIWDVTVNENKLDIKFKN